MNLYVATNGIVVALDARSGRELWRTKLQTFDSRTQVLEHDGCVYASTCGKVYGLDGETGEILWHNGLPGLGYGDVTLSIAGKQTHPMPPVSFQPSPTVT